MNKIIFFILSVSFLSPWISWCGYSKCTCPKIDISSSKIGMVGGNFSEELLYWVGQEKGLGFTNRAANVLITDDFTQNSVINPTFQWDFGFRFGGGYTQCNRRWSYQAYWTYLRSKAYGYKSVNSGSPDFLGIYPIWSMGPDTLASDYVSSASSSWHLYINLLDLIAQYNSPYLWKRLIFMPFLGARGVILSQKLTADYAGGSFFNGLDHNALKSTYLGAGPRLGLNADCCLAYGFFVCGRAALAPLFGCFYIKQKETYLGSLRFHRSSEESHLVLSADFEAGLKWKEVVIKERLCLILGLSWEGQELFYVNRFYRGRYHFFEKNRNLFLQGLTGSATLDF